MSHPASAMRLAIRHYLRQIWIERSTAIPGFLLPGIGTIFTTYIPPLIVAAVISRFGGTSPTLDEVLPYLGWFALAWMGGEVIWRFAFYFLNRADARAMRNLYINAMNELFKKDIGFFHDNFAGSLTKKTLSYGKSFENFADTISFRVLANVIPMLFAVVILWRYSPWLVVILLGMMGIITLFIIPLIKRRQILVKRREVASNAMAGYVADVIGNIDAVQAFAHEDHEAKNHQKNVVDYMTKAQRSWDFHNTRLDASISPFFVLTNVLGLAFAILVGKDASTIAAVFVTFNYYVYTTRILWEFNQIYRNIESSLTEAAQFTELLLAEGITKNLNSTKRLKVTKGEIEFKNVHFNYSDSNEKLFENLQLHIKPGEKVALVGHSGGGKTTVTKLLLRFKEITDGQLLIDGQNVTETSLDDLRIAIANVPQEPVMFHRSIADNIRYGKLDATDEEVLAAAKRAHADEFVDHLPQGYETMVGERGVKLSGGQRQRIAIARALIKNAPILVLDEATSALDSESEVLIQDALWKLMKGRTAIVIAHRLSTIQKMDRIIVLDKGRITEEGTHKQLLEQKGIYATLWKHQSGGFLEE